MYKRRVDKVEMYDEQLQEEMANNGVTSSEQSECVGTFDTEMGRDRAGAKVIEGLEQPVKNTASTVIGKKLIVCNRAVKL